MCFVVLWVVPMPTLGISTGGMPRSLPLAPGPRNPQQFSFWHGPLRRWPLRPCLGRGTRRGQHRAGRAHGSPPGLRADGLGHPRRCAQALPPGIVATSLRQSFRKCDVFGRPLAGLTSPVPKDSQTIHSARPRAGRAARARGDVRSGARPRVLRPRTRASTRTPYGLAPPAEPFPSPPSSIAAAASARGSPLRFATGWNNIFNSISYIHVKHIITSKEFG